MPLIYRFYSFIFLRHLSIGLAMPIMVIWQNTLGLNFYQISILQTISMGLLIVLEFPSSVLADVWGNKKTLYLSVVFLIFYGFGLSFAQGFWSFLCSQSALYIALALQSGTIEAWLHDFYPKESEFSKRYAQLQVSDELGTMTGLLLSSVAVSFVGPRFSFVLIAFFAVFSFIFLSFIKVPPSKANLQKPKFSESWLDWKISLKTFTRHYKVYWKTVFFLLLIIACMALRGEILFQAFFGGQSVSLGSLGWMYFLAKFGSVFGSTVLVFIGPKQRAFSLFSSIFLQFIAFCLLLLTHAGFGVLALFLFFAGENIFRNISKGLIVSSVPLRVRASCLSFTSMSSSLLVISLLPVLGRLLEYDFFSAVFLVILCKLLALIGAIAFFFLRPTGF